MSNVDTRDRRWLWIGLLLAIGTIVVYGRVFVCGFVDYDDARYIGHPLVQKGISLAGIVWAFTGIHASNWHPVTTISHMLDCTMFGNNALGHHAVNLLFHVANVVLLFLVLGRMTKSLWKSAFVAALFAVHPLHVESVAWVAERKDVLSTCFWMLTMGAYVLYAENPSRRTYIPVIVLFALGLMSKPMLVTLPIVLLLLDYWPLGRLQFAAKKSKKKQTWPGWSLIVEKIPLFGLAVIAGAITYYVQHKGGAGVTLAQIPLAMRFENAALSYVRYIHEMVWPSGLTVFYPYELHPPALWKPLLALVFLAGVTAFVIRAARSRPYLAVGWLWYLGTLIPVIGLIQVGEQSMADRYTYVPLIGLFVAIAWGVPDLLSRRVSASPRPRVALGLAAASALIVVALAVATWVQVGYWRDKLTLFTHAIEVTDNNYLAHDMVGAALSREGKNQRAIEHFNKAIQIKPSDPLAYNNLGNAYTRMGRLPEAVAAYDEAIRIKPETEQAHFNRGIALVLLGRLDEAISEFSTVKELILQARGHPEIFTTQSDENAAIIRRYEKAVSAQPGNTYVRSKLATAYAQAGKLDEAISILSELSQSGVRVSKGQSSSLGTTGDRIEYFRSAVQKEPGSADAHYGLGNALSDSGQKEEAIREFHEAICLKPDHLAAHNNLAVALYFTGRYAEAWGEVHVCRRLGTPPHPGFVKALSAKMADTGN